MRYLCNEVWNRHINILLYMLHGLPVTFLSVVYCSISLFIIMFGINMTIVLCVCLLVGNILLLWQINWNTGDSIVVIDVVHSASKDAQFLGIYGSSLPNRCWHTDSTHVFLSTSSRSRKVCRIYCSFLILTK